MALDKLPHVSRRPIVLLVVLFAMLWQSVALAWPGSASRALADVEHVALHLQGQSHHHHDDGSYHVDESSESSQHVIADHTTGSAALIVGTACRFDPSAHLTPDVDRAALAPEPFLDVPLRPPRQRS
jgi:hypothetical protein